MLYHFQDISCLFKSNSTFKLSIHLLRIWTVPNPTQFFLFNLFHDLQQTVLFSYSCLGLFFIKLTKMKHTLTLCLILGNPSDCPTYILVNTVKSTKF